MVNMHDCQTGLYVLVYIVTFVLGFPANVLAFYTFCKKVREKPRPIDILLLNLTISDLLFLLFLPFKMQEVMNDMVWKLPYALCPLSSFVFYMTIDNSTFFLTAVSVERYLGVAFPIQHSLKHRPMYAVAASIIFWIISLINNTIVFIVPFIGQDESQNSTSVSGQSPKEVCYKNFSEAQLRLVLPVRLASCIWVFCLFLISSFCYINFIRILSKLQHIDRRRRLRAIGMALGTLVVFALCFGPFNASHIYGYIKRKDPAWRDIAVLLSTFNACLDPLIFYFSSSAVRGTVSKVVEGVKHPLCRCMSCHVFQASQRGINRAAKDEELKQSETNAIFMEMK